MTTSVGEQLKQARIALHLGLKDITKATKIQPWVLEALESDTLHTTMSVVYTKGFLTTYAKFLRLNANQLTAQLFPEPPPPPVAASEAAAVPVLTWDLEPLWPLLRRVGTAAVSVAAIVLLMRMNPLRGMSSRLPKQEASVSVSKPHLVPAVTALHLQPTQLLEFSLKARRATWVTVTGDGRLLAQEQLVAGAQETWTAKRRLEVTIAKPAWVDVTLNGHSIGPLAMAHHGRFAITHTRITPLSDVSAEPATEPQ